MVTKEKVLAGLAYVFGRLPALVIWLVKKDESRAVGFHAMQAVLYSTFADLLVLVLMAVQLVFLPFLMGLTWLLTNLVADGFAPKSPVIFLVLSLLMMLVFMAGIALVSAAAFSLNMFNIVGAICICLGKDWRYPVLARWAEKINHHAPLGA
jgi:uncharacterized membrane protein